MIPPEQHEILKAITHVIAITGPKGGGKSTFAEGLRTALYTHCKYPEDGKPFMLVATIGFAYQLKAEIITALFGELYDEPDTYFNTQLKTNYPPIRRLLQDWGDWRKQQDPLYWCKVLAENMLMTAADIEGRQTVVWIIPDLRFPEELDFLRTVFGKRLTTFTVVPHEDKIDRKDHHNSEMYWDKMKTDFTIPNLGSVEQLKASAELYIKDTYGQSNSSTTT